MSNLSQQQIEDLIQFINNTEEPGSVTNLVVGAVLGYLLAKAPEPHSHSTTDITGLEATIAAAFSVYFSNGELKTSALPTDFLTQLSNMFDGYATIGRSKLLNLLHSRIMLLDSMGQQLDGTPYTYEDGDLVWSPGEKQTKTWNGSSFEGGETYLPRKGVVFINKHTGKCYMWDGSSMVEIGSEGNDIYGSIWIHKMDQTDVANIPNGQIHFMPSTAKLVYRISSEETISWTPKKHLIYVGIPSNTLYRWTGFVFEAASSSVQVVNSLASNETDKALSAKMGHDLLVLIQQIYNSLGNAAFWGTKPEIDWSSIGLLTHAVTRNLSHCHSNKTYNQIADGSSLNETITFDEGYVKDTLTVTMNNEEVPIECISGNNINIPSVTGPVVITATATAAKSVSFSLNGCKSSNDDTAVNVGAAYTTKIEGDGINKVVGKSGFSVKMKNEQGDDVTLPIVLEDGYPRDSAPSENNHIDIDSVPCVVFKSDLTSIENGAKVQIGKPYYEVRIPEVTGNITIVATAVDFIVAGPWYIGSSTPGSSETWCRNSEPIPIARVSPFDTIVWAHYGVLAGQTGNALANKAVCEFNSHYFHKAYSDSVWKYNQNSDTVTETGDRATQARLIFASFTYQYLSQCYVQGSGGNNTTAIFKPSVYVENQ